MLRSKRQDQGDAGHQNRSIEVKNRGLPEEYPETREGGAPCANSSKRFGPCHMMVFQGPPFPDEKFGEAINAVWKAMEQFNPTLYGWQWADDDAPRYQLAPIGERG